MSYYNYTFIRIAFCAAACCSAACSDDVDYLDKPEPLRAVSKEAVYSSPAATRTFFDGIYRRFRLYWSLNTDVGGVYSVYFARSNKGFTLVNPDGWYDDDYKHAYRGVTDRRPIETWNFLFYLVGQANNLIEGIDKAPYDSAFKPPLLGEARALRAYAYFQLALDYAISYPYDKKELAPPIRTTPSLEDAPMSTLEELYAFILEDLDYAIANMTDDRVDKSNLNLTVLKGLKVRVLMAMDENWPEIERLSQEVYGSVAEALVDYDDGFDDANRSDWLWAMIQTSDQSAYYYTAPAAFTDHTTVSYQNIYMYNLFVESFSDTDVRKLFATNEGEAATSSKRYTTTKYHFAFDTDMLIMRKAEFLLAHIEALYHQGRESEAHDLLFQMQQARDPQAVKSAAQGPDLLEEILQERVKELYIEFGVEWFDAKRLQRGIERKGPAEGGNHFSAITLSPNDVRFELKVPQNEIDANDSIDSSVNANR